MKIIGIDPGMEGAVATLPTVEFYDTPVAAVRGGRAYLTAEMVSIIERLLPVDIVAIEASQAFPQMGGVPSFKLGYGAGLWEGALAALHVPYERVRPNDWKREFGMLGQEKGYSRVIAERLYPAAAEYLRLVKHHNRADALLLAEYVRRKLSP